MTKKSGSIKNTTALQARKTLLRLGVWSVVGRLTRMFRRFPSTRTLCLPSRAFPDQWPAFAEKAALHTYSTNWELISSPVVFRVLTWFPCSANKNTCPARKRGRVFATKAGAIFNCCERKPRWIYDTFSDLIVNTQVSERAVIVRGGGRGRLSIMGQYEI